jgi:hypothetical protein
MQDKAQIVKWRDAGLTRAVSLVKMVNLFEEYGSQGMTTREIDRMMGGKQVATRVMARFPELRAAYHRGIDGRTVDAEAALLQRATGFTKTSKKKSTRVYKGETELFESEEDVFYPPDVAAIRLLLMNRERTRYNADGDNKPAVVINFNEMDKAL